MKAMEFTKEACCKSEPEDHQSLTNIRS